MLEVASLGSGSAGNAFVVRAGGTALLIDCGFTLRDSLARLDALGVAPTDLDAILVTHEHGDHLRGVGPLSRRFRVPVWLTHGTYRRARDRRFASMRLFHAHERFAIGDIEIDPFPTPHDAAESCQFVFDHGGARFACVTDLGQPTPHVREKIDGVNGILVECNYDTEMLRAGPYPPSLQARIRSDYGHLGNEQAADLIATVDHESLHCILLGHLSERNNAPPVARRTVCAAVATRPERVRVLPQHGSSGWFRVARHGVTVDAGSAA